jgi:hypothetical protein
MLLLARLAVRFVPPARLFKWADRRVRAARRFAVAEADWVAWAIESVAGRPGVDALCLPRALAAHAMLRRRGIASRLCLGVARNGEQITAHAWTEVDERKVIGGEDAASFTQLAVYGAR